MPDWIVYIALAILLLGLVLTPRYGLLARFKSWRATRQREQVEDALKFLLDAEQEWQHSHPSALAGALGIPLGRATALITRMQAQGLVAPHGAALHLTAEGERWALHVVRAHPYYGYARQDRKDKPRVPISSKLVADLLTAAGADRILTMDLHAGQFQGFFNIAVDHLFAAPVLIDYIRKLNIPDLTLVSPDAGGVERTRAFAKRLNADLAIVDKRRVSPNHAEVMHVIGHVQGRNILIVDDMVNTAGTLVNTVSAIRKKKANRILACATHAVLSGPASERLREAALDEIILTNTVSIDKAKILPNMTVLSVARLLAEAVGSIHEKTSVSDLIV